jgi:2-oxoglutarate dehydrogenase E2 component (dihydrolipoamide succinyltransferase)
MPIEVKVPSVGESITTGILGKWSKPDGASVKAGEILFDIETEKVTTEVVADVAGKLKHLVKAGDTVKIGQVVAQIDESAAGESAPAPAPSAAAAPATAPAPAPAKSAEPTGGSKSGELSPAVRYITAEKNVDPANIAGTGKDGRILKGDVLNYLEKPPAPTPAAPVVAPAAVAPTPAVTAPVAPATPVERTTRKKMSQLRQKIAARLLAAQHETAHLTTFNEVDLTAIMALRGAKLQDRFTKKHGVKLGFMSFFVKATVYALKAVPAINTRLDGDEVVQNHFYDIGVAISTEKGLMVPVLRGADALSYAGVEKAIAAYATKARDGKITMNDLDGGVFTITNGGVFGSLLSTPILNPPQCAILGMHTIPERPMAVNGSVEIRSMMYLALTYDHRLVDGKEAVTFLATIKEVIENPGVLLLELI